MAAPGAFISPTVVQASSRHQGLPFDGNDLCLLTSPHTALGTDRGDGP